MRIKTKITAWLLAAAMVVSLTGCGKHTTPEESENQGSVDTTISGGTEASTDDVSGTEGDSAADTTDTAQKEERVLTAEEQANLQDLLAFYEYWKERYVVKDDYVTDEDQYYIWYSNRKYKSGNKSVPVTVSEAHGYGMLTLVMMAEYDDEAQTLFDGMIRYYNVHRSSIGPYLMSFQQSDNGTALIDGASDGAMEAGNGNAATDGDMDIAYALLCADKVWGSAGEFDYKTLALNILDDIMKYEISQVTFLPNLGDWCFGAGLNDKYLNATRSSDFLMSHFPAFYEATGDDRWNKVYENTYALIEQGLEEYKTGLLPDFWKWTLKTREYSPAGEYFLENQLDGGYGYNSCRIPWRIGADYLLNGNETAKKFAETINSFIYEAAGGDSKNIAAGYQLDGTKVANYSDLCFTAPFLITAKCCDNKEWEENLRSSIVSKKKDVYYGDSIKMLVLLLYNDMYIVP